MDKKHQIAENKDNHALIAQHQSGSLPREDAGEAPAGRTTAPLHEGCIFNGGGMTQHTYEIETTAGICYLVLEDDEDVEELFELYKKDEAGEAFKDAELLSYAQVN